MVFGRRALSACDSSLKPAFMRGVKEKRFSCTVCTKSFTGRDKFNTHLARHSQATDFMCDDCGEQCKRKDKLREHGKRMHNEGDNFTCPNCQKTFTEYPNIRKHMGHIHEEKVFSCTVCTKSFNGRDKFKTHLARHSEATDVMCDDCGEQCKRKDKLGDHGKRMHNVLSRASVEEIFCLGLGIC